MDEYHLTDIYIYPIKSLGGIRLEHAEVEDKGLKYDRQWMLIDRDGTFVSQRKHHQLSLLQVSIENSLISITHKNDSGIQTSFDCESETGQIISVTVWDDSCMGMEVSTAVNTWFSSLLEMDVRLVKMLPAEQRLVDPKYAKANEVVRFSDGYPFLIIGQASLDKLNDLLDQKIRMDRFRPNFVFSGGEAHQEDSFASFRIGEITFSAVKPCARCVLITVDQQSGKKGAEPLKTLASYRTRNNKIMFGQNLIHCGYGSVHVGDAIQLLSTKMPV